MGLSMIKYAKKIFLNKIFSKKSLFNITLNIGNFLIHTFFG
jgi:hypothetical protein